MVSAGTVPQIALAVALTAPVILAIPKAAGLRDAIFAKWDNRVDLAFAGLTERASALLRRLQRDTQELLGDAVRVDPDAALRDPAALISVAANFQRTMRVRSQLRRRYRLLLNLVLIVPLIEVAWLPSVWGVTAHNLDWLKWRWLPGGAYALGSVVVALAVMGALAHFYLESRLTTADMMSRPAGSSSKRRSR